jgi:hypothetical protein
MAKRDGGVASPARGGWGGGGGENVGLELARTQDIRSQKFFVTEDTEESRSVTE